MRTLKIWFWTAFARIAYPILRRVMTVGETRQYAVQERDKRLLLARLESGQVSEIVVRTEGRDIIYCDLTPNLRYYADYRGEGWDRTDVKWDRFRSDIENFYRRKTR